MNAFKAARKIHSRFQIANIQFWHQFSLRYGLRISRLSRDRVPVRLQLSAVECGAACLAMILSYFGRKSIRAKGKSSLSARPYRV
jgi:ATP-binding cassette, subfamily B, bacterial